MEKIWYPLVWLSRLRYCRGFGIQSPTDYQFVCSVVNEHGAYYAYEQLDSRGDEWLMRRLGRLSLRLANYLQPLSVVAPAKFHAYLHAGCQKATLLEASSGNPVDLAIIDSPEELASLLPLCHERTVVMVFDIRHHREQWRRCVADEQTGITFDLYYCGIVMFDKKRVKQHYIINF